MTLSQSAQKEREIHQSAQAGGAEASFHDHSGVGVEEKKQ